MLSQSLVASARTDRGSEAVCTTNRHHLKIFLHPKKEDKCELSTLGLITAVSLSVTVKSLEKR